MSTAQHQKACKEEIQRCYDYAIAKYGIEIPNVPVVFSNQLKSTAGKVCYKRVMGEIKITKLVLSNPVMALQPEKFISNTPGHEAAHVICTIMYGYKEGHGRNWKRMMRELGLSEARCHTMETATTTKTARVPVNCACTTHMVTKQRVAKMRRGARYVCKKCQTALKLGTQEVLPVAASAPQPAPRTTKPVTRNPSRTGKPSKASYVQELIAMYYAMGREEMVVVAKRKNIEEGWGIPAKSVRTYVIGNMKKVGR